MNLIPQRVLVVHASASKAKEQVNRLLELGFVAESSHQTAPALQRLRRGDIAVLFCSADFDNGQLLARLPLLPNPPTVVATSSETMPGETDFLGTDIYAWLSSTCNRQELERETRRALGNYQLQKENRELRHRLAQEYSLDNMVGRDPAMLRLFDLARSAAPTRASILISGESGTGKSLLAQAIHRLSDRSARPFVVVSCGSLPESLLESELFGHARGAFTGAHRDKKGRFEQAHQGTLFLDEIGTASAGLQIKLLRFLQDRTFERVGESRTRSANVRLLFATNMDLQTAVSEGRFRADLYYRLNVIHLALPPLRERPGDLLLLTRRLLERTAFQHGRAIPKVPRQAARRILEHSWPGNVRELENALERALLLSQNQELEADYLPAPYPVAASATSDAIPLPVLDPKERYSLKKLLEEPERRIIQAALDACNGNRARTAILLGINRATLFAKLKRLGIGR